MWNLLPCSMLGHAVHELPNSGHWVHTDNPNGLFDILSPSFGANGVGTSVWVWLVQIS